MIKKNIEWVIWKIEWKEVHKKVITHHLRTAATYVSWYIEMCDNWKKCNHCNSICKNTQTKINNIIWALNQKSKILDIKKDKIRKIPTSWFPNKKALEEIHKILIESA